jgi:hypothetical protein
MREKSIRVVAMIVALAEATTSTDGRGAATGGAAAGAACVRLSIIRLIIVQR